MPTARSSVSRTRARRGPDAPALAVAVADETQRREIERIRHDVYAAELDQHPTNGEGRLRDPLDERNIYLAACRGTEICGFISITPPPPPDDPAARYSIDKYFDRADVPLPVDDGLYEVRLLTVPRDHRGTRVAALLAWAALRWIEARGGRHIIAIGRCEVMPMYRRMGLQPFGRCVRSGAVTFELMGAAIDALHEAADEHREHLCRFAVDLDWRLDAPFEAPAPCYHGGAFFDAIGPRFDALHRADEVINADVLDAPFDPAPAVVEALRERLPWLLRTSPPTGCEGFIDAVAEARGVEPGNVLPGAGSSDLIFLALRQWLTPRSRALILDPTYGEYAHVLERVVGCRVDRLPLSRANNYDVPLERLRERLSLGCDLVVIVNPNSPTGRFLCTDALRRLIAHAPPTTRFWIDETYIEYVGSERSLERFAASSTNTVVCKSMSKVYALSGARAAYLVGPRHIIEPLRPLNPPWALGLPAQVAAVTALDHLAYYRTCWQRVHALREDLRARLIAAVPGIDIIPGVANFLLCHLPPDAPSAAEVVQRCRRRDVFIRDASNMGRALGDRTIRIAVKDERANRRIATTLRDAIAAH